MNQTSRYSQQNFRPVEAGFSLIELLVGAAIGIFLVGGIIQIYLSTKQTYNITQGVGRIQEDTRFAYHFITRDLRETSNLGCLRSIRDMNPTVTNLNDLEIKVGGWDHNNTSPGNTAITLPTTYAVSTTASNWVGLNNGVNTQAPNDVQSIPNSDALLIKKITPIENAEIVPSGGAAPFTQLTVSSYTPSVGEVLIVGNCQRADMFTVDTVIPSGSNSTVERDGPFNLLLDWQSTSQLYSVSNVLYYVGLRAGATTPSLFRKETNETAEELVEGVESMQILYGVDTDADTTANRYVSARDVGVTQWENVVSIRVGLLLIALGGKERGGAAQSFIVGDGTTFTAAANDTGLRYTSNITVKTRNLGLTENFSVCRAGSSAPCDTVGYETATIP